MIAFVLRRLGWAVTVLLLVGTVTFLLLYLSPADPARAIAGPHASAVTLREIRAAYHLDDPWPQQLAGYFGRLFQGDLGRSIKQNTPVLPLIVSRLPATLQLALAGLAVEMAIGLPLGLMAARRPNSLADRTATIGTSILVAAPSFWVGYLLLNGLAFQPKLHFGIDLFPNGGYKPLDLRYLALPALTLGFSGAAYYARLTRATVLDELSRDYVRTARAKGLSERRITWGHVLPNAFLPLLTQFGLDVGVFMGGVVVVEQIFSWPGIGRLAIESIPAADIPVVMGVVIFGTLCIVLANLAVDVIYALIDPRLRNR